jgi:hypothetical protein
MLDLVRLATQPTTLRAFCALRWAASASTEMSALAFIGYLPVVVREEGDLVVSAQGRSSNPFIIVVVILLLTISNLLFFRKGRA